MTHSIDRVERVDEQLLATLNRLLSQLSSTAPPMTVAELEAIIDGPTSVVLVARVDDHVVGMLTLVTFAIPSGLRAWIEDVVVDDQRRGTGVGKALTLAAINHARTMGARSVDLTSRPSREVANRLYVKLGFQRRDTNVYRLSL